MRSNPTASPFATRALITHAGATRRLTRALGAGVLAGSLLAAGPGAMADDYIWDPGSTNWNASTSWNNTSNPFDVIIDDGTVPDGTNDTATINILGPAPQLTSNRAVGNLTLSAGGDLFMNNFLLTLNPGAGTTGTTLVTGGGSVLFVEQGTLDTENLTLSSGGTLNLAGGLAQMDTNGSFGTGTFVTGFGTIEKGGSSLLSNNGIITASGGTLTIRRAGGTSNFDWDGGGGGGVELQVNGGATMSIQIPTAGDDFSSMIDLNGGTFNVTNPWGKDGTAAIEMNGNNSITGAAWDLGGSAPMNVNSGTNTISSTGFSTSGSSSIIVDPGATLVINTAGKVLNGGTTYTANGILRLDNNSTLNSTTFGGSGTLNINTGVATLNGTTTFNSLTVDLDAGTTMNANGNIVVNGATFNRNGTFNLAANQSLTASNNGQVNFSSYDLDDNTTFTFNTGADFNSTSYFDIGNVSDGTLVVDGAGTTFSFTGSSYWGSGGGSSTVTVSNNAVLTAGGTTQVVQGIGAGTTSTVSIESGGDINLDGLNIASSGATGSTGTFTVTGGGSTATQSGASTLIIGHATDGTGTLNVNSSGAFNTGTGTTTINATGTINATTGILNANGDINLVGGTINSTNGRLNIAANKTLTATANGQLNITGTTYRAGNDVTYNITDGSDFTLENDLLVGTSGAANAVVTIDGAGSSLTTNTVGAGFGTWIGVDNQTGVLNILNNAQATFNDRLRIGGGNSSAGVGTVNIESGADATSGNLEIGNVTAAGIGELNVTGAGSTFSQTAGSSIILGLTGASSGEINVTNSAVFNASNTGAINVNATGTLNVNSATFNAKGVNTTSGGTINTSGDVNITGSGRFNLDGGTIPLFSVSGSAGHGGNLNMTGGTVDLSGSAILSGDGGDTDSSGSNRHGGNGGDITINGGTLTAVDSSRLLFTGGVGAFGGGTEITGLGGNGGTVTVTSGNLSLFDTTSLNLNAGNANGTHQKPNRGGHGGIVTVNGGNISLNNSATLTLNGGKGSNAIVSGLGGNGGDGGQILVSVGSFTVNGGDVTLKRGNPGSGPGGLGVAGADAIIDITGGSFVMNGGTVLTNTFQTAAGLFTHNDGKLTVSGGTFNPSVASYTIDGAAPADLPTLVLTDGATAPGVTGVMAVGSTNRARLEILNGASLSSSTPDLGSLAGSQGQALVDGAGSLWTTSSDLAVGEQGKGDLVVSNGGAINSGDDIVFGRSSTADGAGLVTSGGSIDASSGIWVGEGGTGYLEIGPNASATSSFMYIAFTGGSTGTFDINGAGATVDVNGTIDMRTSGATLNLSDGTLTANTIQNTAGGTFNMTGGTLVVNNFNGTLDQQGGTVAPGSSPGITNVSGDYNILGGTLAIEIDGDTPGIGHDRVNVSGAANLGGELDLSVGFSPSPYDAFTILTSSTLNNTTFDTIAGNYYTSGRILAVTYTATDVVIIDALRGDLDLDGDIDGVDISAMFVNFNGPGGGVPGNPLADLDGDGDVDGVDISQAFVAFTGPLAPATVPEPTSLALLGLGGLLAMRRRRAS